MAYLDRLHTLVDAGRSRVLLFSPGLFQMPLPMQRYDDPFLPFTKALIKATYDQVAVYIFDFASYLSIGAAGIVAMERAIAYAKMHDTLTLLHMPISGQGYTTAISRESLAVDAVTLVETHDVDAYAAILDGGVYLYLLTPAGTETTSVMHGQQRLIHPTGLTLPILSESVVYAGRGESFAEDARTMLLSSSTT